MNQKTHEEYLNVLKLKSEGVTISEIARITNLTRSCVNNWIHRGSPSNMHVMMNGHPTRLPTTIDPIEAMNIISPIIDDTHKYSNYSFILGLFLGDGCIYQAPRTIQLSVVLDKKYEEMNNNIVEIMSSFFGKRPLIHDLSVQRRQKRIANAIVLKFNSINLGIIFPYLGGGRKDTRSIKLQEWQLPIINWVELLKGLMMSDGCYHYRASRNSYHYEFSNKSRDIIDIAATALNKLGIHHSISFIGSIYRIKIDRVHDVTKLHSMIGDKKSGW